MELPRMIRRIAFAVSFLVLLASASAADAIASTVAALWLLPSGRTVWSRFGAWSRAPATG